MTAAPIVSIDRLAGLLLARREPGEVMIAGITGSVASGKSTLAAALAERIGAAVRVDLISTDGFLRPNADLEPQGLLMRKGFPESYDLTRFRQVLEDCRNVPVRVPGYSHSLYDIDPALERLVDRPDLLLVEGLGFAPDSAGEGVVDLLDTLIYLDADEPDLEHWFLERFMGLWHAAADDPASFYARFRSMNEAEARGFARTTVWRGINLPNLHENIVRARPLADILLQKTRDHQLRLVRPELSDF
jgi:type I pantothenate kinase